MSARVGNVKSAFQCDKAVSRHERQAHRPESVKSVLSILREIARERMIAVLVSLHQVDFALRFADRVIGLRAGRVIADRSAALFAEADRRMVFST